MSSFKPTPITVAVALTCALACSATGAQQVHVKKRGQTSVTYTLKDAQKGVTTLAVNGPRGQLIYGAERDNVVNAMALDDLQMLPQEQRMYTQIINEASSVKSEADRLRAEVSGKTGKARTVAGWSAVTDGASTLGVLAAGGVEFNPLMPTSPAGIVAMTAAKAYAATGMLDGMAPEEQDRIRRLASAGWTGATVANVAALAGLFPASALPIGMAAGLLQYRSGEEQAQKHVELAQLDQKTESLVATAQSYRTQSMIAAHQRRANTMLASVPVASEGVVLASAETGTQPLAHLEQREGQKSQVAHVENFGRMTVRQGVQQGTKEDHRAHAGNVGAVYIYTDDEVQQVVSDRLSAERAALVQQQLNAGLAQRPSTVVIQQPAQPVVPPAFRVSASREDSLPPVSISTPYGAYTPHPSRRAQALARAQQLGTVAMATPAVGAVMDAPVGQPSLDGGVHGFAHVPATVRALPRGGVQVSDLNGRAVETPVDVSSQASTRMQQTLNAVNVQVPAPVAFVSPAAAGTSFAVINQPSSLRVGQDVYERALAFLRKSLADATQPLSHTGAVSLEPTGNEAAQSSAPVQVVAQPAPPVQRLVRDTLVNPKAVDARVDAQMEEPSDLMQGGQEQSQQNLQARFEALASVGAVQSNLGLQAQATNFALGDPVPVDTQAVSPLAQIVNLPTRRVPTVQPVEVAFKSGATLQEIQRQYDFERQTVPRYLQKNPTPEQPVYSYWD